MRSNCPPGGDDVGKAEDAAGISVVVMMVGDGSRIGDQKSPMRLVAVVVVVDDTAETRIGM